MNEKDQIQEIVLLGTFNYPAVEVFDLLEKGAKQSLAQKAGFAPQKSIFPQVKPFLEESSVCKVEAGRILTYILKHKKRALLKEFLLLASRKKVRIPTNFLPQLAEASKDFPELKHLILGVLGKWGAYVAKQNDEWQFWATDNPKNWSKGNTQEKADYLQIKFETAPKEAVILTEEFIASSSKNQQEVLFSQLKVSNSPQYKQFLESQLTDKKSNLRLIALRNLAILGDANVLSKLESIFKSVFNIKNAEISIQIPTGKSLLWDLGFDKKNWIEDFCTCLPFEFWQNHFKITSEQLIESITNSKHTRVLFLGTLQNAIQSKNQVLIYKIFKKSYSDLTFYKYISEQTRKNIFETLKKTELEELVNIIFGNSNLADFYFLVGELIKYSQAWTEIFAQKFLIHFENKLEEPQTAIFLNKTLLDLIHHLPLSSFQEVNIRWQELAYRLPSLAWQIERALHEFRIRKELQKGFN
jgi:hypothetical protein